MDVVGCAAGCGGSEIACAALEADFVGGVEGLLGHVWVVCS